MMVAAGATSAPLYHGCLDATAQALPYCNSSLDHLARANDIISRLNTTEKIGLVSPHDPPHYCACAAAPVPRIGLPGWKWLTEINTNVGAAQCVAPNRCPTVFIGPLGVAASFNRSLWWAKGDVLSTELRAFNNLHEATIGLSAFGPNINLVKDPRYGRNSELAGEDPFLAGSYAVSFVQGMQQTSASGNYKKMLAYLKHYTAYSKEAGRFTWAANVSNFDLWDSYLPQYAMGFQQGGASGAMCSYFAPNGIPSCGSDLLMNQIVRGKWGRPDAVFMSDCSAVANMVKTGYAANATDASAKALNGGLDIYGGWDDDLWTQGYLEKAINAGQARLETLNAVVRRTILQKLQAGVFDPLDGQPWTKLGAESVNSSHARAVAYEAALQSLVLLKNANGTLPFPRGRRLAVVGPLALETTGLQSDYAAWVSPVAPDSIAAALTRLNPAHTTVARGVPIAQKNSSGIGAALDAVKQAEVTVLVLGQTKDQERETLDRTNTSLPGLQQAFAEQVLQAAGGRPVVLVLCNGGILSIDTLINGSGAIIEAFNPIDHGARALAASIFGEENRWGKLPVTIYNRNYTAELDAAGAGISDYAMAKAPGRSYRYYSGVPLFPFGHGLSYTRFAHTCARQPSQAFSFSCTVSNTGSRSGDEVLQVYHALGPAARAAASQAHLVPFRTLVEFARVTVPHEGKVELTFTLSRTSFAVTTKDGSPHVYPGVHEMIFSRGTGVSSDEVTIQVQL